MSSSPSHASSVEYHPTLRRQVADLLAASDNAAAQRFLDTFPPIADETADAEIRRLNRYWRHQLNQLEIDTIPQRDHLAEPSTESMWISLFAAGVLPTALQFHLPV